MYRNMDRTCITPGCIKPAESGRRKCSTCRKRERRAADPLWAAWARIRDRAKSRGIPFRLPLDVFREAAAEVGYVEKKGRAPHCLHLDRIDATRGYQVGNLQFLTASENCAKGARERGRVIVDDENEPF